MRRLSLLCLFALAAPLASAQPVAGLDSVRAQPLDGGKMWLFESPPTAYLASRYNFRPDAAWYERTRLAALRMPGCSASFVSPNGLVATNHHCAQGSVVAVDRGNEGLLDAGFQARSLADERPVAEMYMDQMVALEDVTGEVTAAGEAGVEAATAAVVARLLAARGVTNPDDETADYVVQVVPLYDGGRYSAYTFRRWRDVRLVMAPEARLGYFGGDYDNFTYPRYAADFAFFRVYGDDGQPLSTENFFPLSTEGVTEGSVVFVVGNPGSTSRALTVAQLEYLRDVQLPATVSFLDSRVAALQAYLASGEAPNPDAVRSQIFGLANGQKAYGGRLRGLRDPYIIARRADAERQFVERSPEAGALVAQMAALQAEKRRLGAASDGLAFLFNPRYGSALLRRAKAVADGTDPAAVAALPEGLEMAYLTAEIEALQRYYAATGSRDTPRVIQTGAAEAAQFLLDQSSLDGDTPVFSESDPAVALVRTVLPLRTRALGDLQALSEREAALAGQLGSARYAAYGDSVPPDATFSLRFTDGVVTGYPYNGTEAPPLTTLYGLFDRHYGYCVAGDGAAYDLQSGAGGCDWELPQRWLDARDNLDLSTPVNFTSTSDTIGGNSGSPVIDREGRLVGLNFDRTIEGLVRDYLYAPERGRNVMVDARLIVEALREVYDLDALADELTTGRLRR